MSHPSAIDACDTEDPAMGLRCAVLLEAPRDRGVVDWHAEPDHQPLGRPPTRAMAKQRDNLSQPSRSPSEWNCQPRKPLGKDMPVTAIVPAAPASVPGC